MFQTCLAKTKTATAENLQSTPTTAHDHHNSDAHAILNESSWIFGRRLFSTCPTLCYNEIQISTKIRVLPSGTLSQTPDLENFATAYRSSKLIFVVTPSPVGAEYCDERVCLSVWLVGAHFVSQLATDMTNYQLATSPVYEMPSV